MKRRPCPDLREYRDEISRYVLARITELPNGCWQWTAHTNKLGYAHGCFKNRQWTITRLVYCATQGGFDPQLDVCHTCDNPSCVNPIHLWLGSRAANICDSVEKGRHHLSAATHCKRGHPLFGDNLYVNPAGKRTCKTCQTARGRMRAGWPEHLAYSMPIQKLGYRPDGIGKEWARKKKVGFKTHCKNGHPLAGDNLYLAPPDFRRQCRTCKRLVVQRLAAERRANAT